MAAGFVSFDRFLVRFVLPNDLLRPRSFGPVYSLFWFRIGSCVICVCKFRWLPCLKFSKSSRSIFRILRRRRRSHIWSLTNCMQFVGDHLWFNNVLLTLLTRATAVVDHATSAPHIVFWRGSNWPSRIATVNPDNLRNTDASHHVSLILRRDWLTLVSGLHYRYLILNPVFGCDKSFFSGTLATESYTSRIRADWGGPGREFLQRKSTTP